MIDHHSPLPHNTLCLPPKILHKHCFWDDFMSQEKLKTMLMQNWGGGGTKWSMGDMEVENTHL